MTRADEDCRLIGAILPQGIAAEVVRKLRQEKGVDRASTGGARGLHHLLQFAPRETVEVVPMEILSVVVPAARADELFEFVFDAACVDRPEGGIVFQHALSGASPFILPDLPEEE